MRTPARGYALNLVMILSALLVVLLATMLFVLSGSARSSGGLIARKQTFFATDGMMRAVVRLSNDFLRRNPAATTADLQAFFDNPTLASITPAGYTLEDFDISTEGRGVGVVPNGPFQGMNATLFPITAKVKLRKLGSLAASRQDMSATLAQIGMFQFMVFIDGYGDWVPGPPQRVDGRVHANGDLCLASNNPFCLSKITASGRINQEGDAVCRGNNPAGAPLVARDATPDFAACNVGNVAEWRTLSTPGRDNGCVNCGGSGQPWATWALTEFGGNVRDVDMGTPSLLLPITGTPTAQAGRHAGNGVATNGSNSRFLVDTVRGGDAGDVRAQKYADKADVRIIDGVWYLKDTSPANTWPGIPIWSDHPGRYTINQVPGNAALQPSPAEASIVGNVAVGQSQLRQAWQARGVPWGALPPRRYSYYEVSEAPQPPTNRPFTMLDDVAAALADGVVSYGTLARIAGPPLSWRPGHWPPDDDAALGATSSDSLCPQGNTLAAPPGFLPYTTAVNCAPAGSIPPADALLNAARAGFRDGHVQENGNAFGGADTDDGGVGDESKHQKVLPMNFDMAAFRAALRDGGPGELGSYFCAAGGACFMGRPFNGIVWIGLTWNGSLNGFAAGAGGTNPSLWPQQGCAYDTAAGGCAAGLTDLGVGAPPFDQPGIRNNSGFAGNADGAAMQKQLPYPLCSDADPPNLANGAVGGEFATRNDTNREFRWPACSFPSFLGGNGARPTAVRIFNAAVVATDVDGNGADDDLRGASASDPPDGVTDGMSIVSNVPVYVLGDWNVRNTAGVAINTTGPTTTPWLPAMVGGDQVYLVSNNWHDGQQPWDVDVNVGARSVATATTYNIEILAGWSESNSGSYSGGVENFPRFIESWSGVNNNINGSLVVGFNSPYYRWPRFCCGNMSYNPPNRLWAFDTHLDTIANQPPGAPEYNVYATRAWTRQ